MVDTNHKEILEAIQMLASRMDEQFEQAEERNNLRFTQLEKTLEERITDLRKDMTVQFGALSKRVDLVEEHLGQRLDLANERIDKLYIAIDGFIVLHKKLDQEFVMLKAKYDRLEIRLSKLEARFAI